MSESLWYIIVIILLLLSYIGAVLPVLPGTVFALIGLVVYKFSPMGEELSWLWIIFSSILVVFSIVMEYMIPVLGTKKFGGTKYGVGGALLGLIVGIFFPFGLIYCPLIGAYLGETLHDTTDYKKALKASAGALMGFLLSMGINLFICGIISFIILFHGLYNFLIK